MSTEAKRREADETPGESEVQDGAVEALDDTDAGDETDAAEISDDPSEDVAPEVSEDPAEDAAPEVPANADASSNESAELTESTATDIPQAHEFVRPPDPEARERRSRLVRKNRELHAQKKRLRIALIVVSVVLALALGGLALEIVDGDARYAQAQRALSVARHATNKATEELEVARAQVTDLVEGRVPGLRAVEYDRVIEVGELGVRNMTFTRTRTARGQRIEVRAVMSNDSKRALDPKVNLVFVDDLGIEMGRARVGIGDGETLDGTRAMLPGEVRSFTSEVRVDRGEEPAYFLVRPR